MQGQVTSAHCSPLLMQVPTYGTLRYTYCISQYKVGGVNTAAWGNSGPTHPKIWTSVRVSGVSNFSERLRVVLFVERKCLISIGSIWLYKSWSYLLYHYSTTAVHNIWAMDVCCYFVSVFPLKMEHFIAFASNNLGNEWGGIFINGPDQRSLEFQPKS